MSDIVQEIKNQFRKDNATVKVAIVCLGYFLLRFIVKLVFELNLDSILYLESAWSSFVMKPWSLLTFVLPQQSIINALFTLVFMYFVERFFRTFFNEEAFWKFFAFGNLVAGIGILLLGLVGLDYVLLGFSSGVYSVFYAVVSYQPKMKIQLFLIPISINLEIIAWVFLGINVVYILSDMQGSGIYVGQLIGSVFGYLYMKNYETGNDFLGKLFSFKLPKIKSKPKFTYEKTPKDDYEFNSQRKSKNDEVDRILEKIADSGYESLSKSEKEFLFKNR
ncbi:MAG: rhomboid family intramembrane serine protease [Flavobacteriales bacterium]|nr:rhomboid family intramembrane serine protease [Flavobacteriales bacterium]